MNQSIQDLLEAAEASSKSSSKYISRLTEDSVEVLDQFAEWLVSAEGKATSTASAYRVYVAQALCHIEDGGEVKDLSTDVKSALNALQRFSEATTADAATAEAEGS